VSTKYTYTYIYQPQPVHVCYLMNVHTLHKRYDAAQHTMPLKRWNLQGYLADKKLPPSRNLQHDYAQGSLVAPVRGGYVSKLSLKWTVSSDRACQRWGPTTSLG